MTPGVDEGGRSNLRTMIQEELERKKKNIKKYEAFQKRISAKNC